MILILAIYIKALNFLINHPTTDPNIAPLYGVTALMNAVSYSIHFGEKTDEIVDLLLKHEGDLVECVLDSYGHKEKKKPETKANTNEQEVFTDLRKIVNEKNKMYKRIV